MKNISIKILGILAVASVFFSSCKKEGVNIFNMFEDVTVTYHSTTPYSVTDYKEVNSGDSVHLDFTINSPKKSMYVLCVFENGAAIPFIKTPLSSAQRHTYSSIVKLKMSNKVGKTSYRVWALDSAGVYMGDGYKTITVEVKANYSYWAGRNLFVPDTLEKTSKSFLAAATGEVFSYTEGATNSAKIDMSLVFVPSLTVPNTGIFNIYALNTTPLPYTPYDISTWTKRATLFAAPKTGQGSAFLNLRTGEQVVSAAKSANPTLKVLTTNIAAGSLFYFKTAEGKFGAFYINYITKSAATKGVFMNVDIKMEK